MSVLFSLRAYLKYRFHSKTRYGVHSPFVFDLISTLRQVDPRAREDLARIEAARRQLLHDRTRIRRQDAGHGGIEGEYSMQIRHMAARHAIPRRSAALLYGLARKFSPEKVIELGTSLGIGTSCLALACPEAHIISIEACPETRARARQHPLLAGRQHLELVCGRFNEVLDASLAKLGRIDMAFIDGDHRKIPTLDNFRKMIPFVHSESILVFDDIHYSQEMEEAWLEIQADPAVRVSIDLFHFGLLFFKKELSPQAFVLRFS